MDGSSFIFSGVQKAAAAPAKPQEKQRLEFSFFGGLNRIEKRNPTEVVLPEHTSAHRSHCQQFSFGTNSCKPVPTVHTEVCGCSEEPGFCFWEETAFCCLFCGYAY